MALASRKSRIVCPLLERKRGRQKFALLTRSFGQRVLEGCDTFTVPQRAQAAGRIHHEKHDLGLCRCQSLVALGDFRFGSTPAKL